tara:strand:- start:1552 stop:1806 length:255 start_codon:yes stop_codon:yes gene_type:complete
MLSIAELIDKLIIENQKIFFTRQKLHSEDLTDEEYVENNNIMNSLNKNRATLCNLLDEKVDKVIAGKEKNSILKVIKTYDTEEI